MDAPPTEGAWVALSSSKRRNILLDWGVDLPRPGRWFSYGYLNAGVFPPDNYHAVGVVVFDERLVWDIQQRLGACLSAVDFVETIPWLLRGRIACMAHYQDIEIVAGPKAPTRRGRKHKMRLSLVYPTPEMGAVDGY